MNPPQCLLPTIVEVLTVCGAHFVVAGLRAILPSSVLVLERWVNSSSSRLVACGRLTCTVQMHRAHITMHSSPQESTASTRTFSYLDGHIPSKTPQMSESMQHSLRRTGPTPNAESRKPKNECRNPNSEIRAASVAALQGPASQPKAGAVFLQLCRHPLSPYVPPSSPPKSIAPPVVLWAPLQVPRRPYLDPIGCPQLLRRACN